MNKSKRKNYNPLNDEIAIARSLIELASDFKTDAGLLLRKLESARCAAQLDAEHDQQHD
jgi:hypothetical protein